MIRFFEVTPDDMFPHIAVKLVSEIHNKYQETSLEFTEDKYERQKIVQAASVWLRK